MVKVAPCPSALCTAIVPALEARYRRSAVSFFLTYQKKILTYRDY